MQSLPRVPLITACASLLFAFSPAARPDALDKRTTVNFSQPVEVPGAVLDSGKYVMRLLDLPSNRHAVQFLNEKEDRVYATALAIPAYRERVTENTSLSFYEAPAGKPEALRAWFYPSDNYGQEFIYPKDRAAELASFRPSFGSPRRGDEDGDEISAPAESAASTAGLAPTNQNAGSDPVDQASTSAGAERSPVLVAQNEPSPVSETPLPGTATHVAEVGMAGFLMLAAAGAVHIRRRNF